MEHFSHIGLNPLGRGSTALLEFGKERPAEQQKERQQKSRSERKRGVEPFVSPHQLIPRFFRAGFSITI
jgi:hypothetical protein